MNIVKIGLGRGIPAIGAVFFSLYLAKELPTKDADVFFLWFSVLYVLSFLGRLGFDTYLLKDLSSQKLANAARFKRTAFFVSIIFSFIACVFSPSEMYALMLSLPFFSVVSINSCVLRAEGRDILGGFLEASLLSLVALLILFLFGMNNIELSIKLASLGFASAAFIVLIVGEFFVGKNKSIIGDSRFALKSDVSAGLRFVLSPLTIYLTQWIAILFLSTAGEGAVSIYSVAVRLASGFAFLAITIDAFVGPRFAQYYYNDDWTSINKLINLVRKKYFNFLMIAFILYTVFGKFFITNFVGSEYVESFYTSLVISASYCFILYVGPYQYLLLMSGSEGKVNFCNGIALLAVIVGSFVLWVAAVQSALAYACIVVVARILSIFMMRGFSLKLMQERDCD